MKRRDFLKTSAITSLLATFPTLLSAQTNYNGKLLVTVYAHGGWDTTSFCDPKINVEGQPIINNWAETLEVQTAGNIKYAPFADNAAFFSKHYKKMLVINGIDGKTNSHERGEIYSLTGTMNDGYPSLAALLAYTNKTNELMPWVHNGFRPRSGQLLAPSLITNSNELGKLKTLANTNLYRTDRTETYLPEEDLNLMRFFRERLARARANDNKQMPKQKQQYEKYMDATLSDSTFSDFISYVEAADTKDLDKNDGTYAQAVAAMASFKAGISLSAELRVSNFDTHSNHDENHAKKLTQLTNQVDLLWELAEQFNLQDRLVVQIVSDISRTPHYNAKGGKDHWVTNSTMIMANNPSWGNRVVGASTEGHRPLAINFDTFEVDENGTKIEPKHIMAAMRKYFLVNTSMFDLDTTQSLDIFNASKSTVQS